MGARMSASRPSTTATNTASMTQKSTALAKDRAKLPRVSESLFQVRYGSFVPTRGSAELLDSVGGRDRMVKITTRFYERAFKDSVLDTFIAERDSEMHGQRLGLWLAEKFGDDTQPWSTIRHRNARSQAHHDAWYSSKRKPELQGRRFKLDDCRIWMRLFFWAVRDEGIFEESPQFAAFLGKFIQHFIAVYEATAPPYTQESIEWSADEANIQRYVENGCEMRDVIGVGVRGDFF